MVTPPVYMDNHATTRVDPAVVQAMIPYWTEHYGNASSTSHVFGWEARDAVDQARGQVAQMIGANAREIVFTSGATESNNLAIRGIAYQRRRRGNHLVAVTTEHKAVLDPIGRLTRNNLLPYEATLLSVQKQSEPQPGWLDPQQVADAIRDDTMLVSVMLANNEIGIVQPLAEIGAICKQRGVLLHCDATQAVGRIPVDVGQLQVDLMSFSGHKIYGPKGVGVLYARRKEPRVRLDPQIDGGGHEDGRRSGTLNVPGIVGLAKALEICNEQLSSESARLASLRDRLFQELAGQLDGVHLNGPPLDPAIRLAGNLNCSFDLVDGEALMMSMRDLAVSSGSACTSANPAPSHVLQALGLSDDQTRASLRFGLGRFNTDADVDFAVGAVCESVQRLRKLSSMA